MGWESLLGRLEVTERLAMCRPSWWWLDLLRGYSVVQ